VVNTVSGSQNILIDPNYSTYTATALWRVEAQGFSCNPTLKTTNTAALKTRTKSNNTNERLSVGIKQNPSFLKNINVYPNPANDHVNIEIVTLIGEEVNYICSITNVLGQELLKINISNQTTTLNIADLKSGIYFFNIKQNNKVVAVKKVVVD
jgi:hypothetical protein